MMKRPLVMSIIKGSVLVVGAQIEMRESDRAGAFAPARFICMLAYRNQRSFFTAKKKDTTKAYHQ